MGAFGNKRLLVVAGIGAGILFGVLVYLTFAGRPQPAPEPEPIATPSATPTGSPVPLPTANESGIVDGHQVTHPHHDDGIGNFLARYPILGVLPHKTPYWALEIGGEVENDKVPLVAKIYRIPDVGAEELVSRQRPYILKFIAGAGQAEGTYDVAFRVVNPPPD